MMSPAAERRSGRQGLSKDARGRYSRFEFLIALPQAKKVMKRSRGGLETVVADAGGPRVRIRLPPAERWYGAGGEGDGTIVAGK
jgi:hypothetical protein